MEGSSKEMEATQRELPRREVIEIATRDDGPYALEARAELVRRDTITFRIGMTVVVMVIALSIGINLAGKL
jgi:hypothetical protein